MQKYLDARNNVGETPLHVACELGCLEIVQELLKHNPNVNAIATKYHDIRFTPIMLAIREDYLEIVEELLKYGANTNNGPNSNNMSQLKQDILRL